MSKRKPLPPPTPGMSAAMEEVLADALEIQDRFDAEPRLKTTGRGALRSRGVDGLEKDADELRRKLGRAARDET